MGEQDLEITLPIWERLSPDVANRAMAGMPPADRFALLNRMDPNRAAVLLAGIAQEDRAGFLASEGDGFTAVVTDGHWKRCWSGFQ